MPILDPVWPWSSLYDLLSPPALVAAALAGAATFALLVAHFLRRRLPALVLLGATALALVFVVRHLWSPAIGEGGPGFWGFLLGVGWLLCLLLLLVAPFALAGVSVGAYAGTQGVSRRKLVAVVALRLLAFFLAFVALARPSFATPRSEQTKSVLYVLLDSSRSMTIEDEGERSRWSHALRALTKSEPALARLKDEHRVEVRFFSFDTELRDFDPAKPGEADGQRTDVANALRSLYDRREADVTPRGLVVLSDGADNGLTPALGEAARWRGVPCLIHAFSCGNPKTTLKQSDVAITSISVSPTPFVPVKGTIAVKVTIDARGFENQPRVVTLYVEGEDGKDVAMPPRKVVLSMTTGNEVTLDAVAPDKPGEVKIKVTVDQPDGDKFPLNNTIETFASVSREGISVLLVDRWRIGEPQAICDVLAEDPRIRVTPLLLAGGKAEPGGAAAKLFDKNATPFDVIVLGDVSIDMLAAADKNAVARIVELVGRGSGLVVLGGLSNLGNGGWKGSALEPLLPVDLTMKDTSEAPAKVVPTDDGLRLMPYLFRQREGDAQAQRAAWQKLAKTARLTGTTKLLPKGATTVVLARTDADDKSEPVLVMGQYSAGDKDKGKAGVARVLVFGGDTTHRWIRDDESKLFVSRFWRQSAVWLANQEDAAGQVWVRPDVRRLPVRHDLGFEVGIRGKGGGPEIRGAKFDVEVVTPDGAKLATPVTRSATENRGTFTATATPGVYRVMVRGEGKDPSGDVVKGEASARVIVYDEDVEMTRAGADLDFLAKLAAAGGGGESLGVDRLPDFLNRLAEKPLDAGRERRDLRPDWQTRETSPFLMFFFLTFCAATSLEWGLRRWWGLK